jgi:hypothetical protein
MWDQLVTFLTYHDGNNNKPPAAASLLSPPTTGMFSPTAGNTLSPPLTSGKSAQSPNSAQLWSEIAQMMDPGMMSAIPGLHLSTALPDDVRDVVRRAGEGGRDEGGTGGKDGQKGEGRCWWVIWWVPSPPVSAAELGGGVKEERRKLGDDKQEEDDDSDSDLRSTKMKTNRMTESFRVPVWLSLCLTITHKIRHSL